MNPSNLQRQPNDHHFVYCWTLVRTESEEPSKETATAQDIFNPNRPPDNQTKNVYIEIVALSKPNRFVPNRHAPVRRAALNG